MAPFGENVSDTEGGGGGGGNGRGEVVVTGLNDQGIVNDSTV